MTNSISLLLFTLCLHNPTNLIQNTTIQELTNIRVFFVTTFLSTMTTPPLHDHHTVKPFTTTLQLHFPSLLIFHPLKNWIWTPKGRSPFIGLFFRFGQAIVDAIFVQNISNFWWICGLVLASGRTNFYKIPISGLAIMPKKQNYFELRAASGSQKTFYFKTFLGWIFFHKFLTKFLNISSTQKSSKTHQIY